MLLLFLLFCYTFEAIGFPTSEHAYVHCSDVLLHVDKEHSELQNLNQDNCTHIGGQILLDCKDLSSANYTRMFYGLSFVNKFVGRLHIQNCLKIQEIQELLPSLKEIQLQYNDNEELESLILENTSLRSLPHNPQNIFYGRVIMKDNQNLSLPVEQYKRYCCMEKWNSECEKHLESGKEKSDVCIPTVPAEAQSLVSPQPVTEDVENADIAPAWLWNRIEGNDTNISWLEKQGAENATNTTGWLWSPGEANSSSSAWLWNQQEPDSSSIYNTMFIIIVNILFVL